MSADAACFVACAEAGPLEHQVILLVRSLRRWGGPLAKAPFYVISPRPGHRVSSQTESTLDQLGATYLDLPLNLDHGQYPVDNKIFACHWAEDHLDSEALVFLDSDTIFVNPPTALCLQPDEVALRPVDLRGAGSTGPGDDRDTYWERAYELCGVSERRHVVTTVDGIKIREYWNAGLVAAGKQTQLFSRWYEHYQVLTEHAHRPARWPRQLDQIALAMATGSLAPTCLKSIDPGYNYPLPRRPWLDSDLANLGWDQLVHLHYHRWFQSRGFLNHLTPPLARADERFAWLAQHLPLEPASSEVFDRHVDNRPH